MILNDIGDERRALIAFRRAVELYPRMERIPELIRRLSETVDGKDLDLAIKLLDAVIDIRPDFVEAWNRRATVYYTKKDFGRALADIHEVLAREPRHFGALSGLGIILQELGDDKHALEAFRRALAVHPRLERIPDLVKKLSDKIDGRDI
jgi:tetratricopeptide (TPR) repeat protein